MKLTRNKIRKLIQESITSHIKQITPLDRKKRELPHAFQQPPIPPETILDPDDRDRITKIRDAGTEEYHKVADELAGAFTGDPKPLFSIPGSDLSTYDYQEIHDALSDAGDSINPDFSQESSFLEINMPFAQIIEDIPHLQSSRLNQIIDEVYETENVEDFYKNIKDYINDETYKQERQDITNAFNSLDPGSLGFGLPVDYYAKQGGFFKANGANHLEDFLLDRAKRLATDYFDDELYSIRDRLK